MTQIRTAPAAGTPVGTRTGPAPHPERPEPAPPRYIGAIWALLLINTLGFNEVQMVIPFPRPVGQLVTMGALFCALGLAMMLNPRLSIRPSPYLLLLSLLLVVSIASSLRLEAGMGALFRCFRGAVFLATLWLISRWWRGDLNFVRYHIRVMGAVLVLVLAGLVIAPGKAFSGPPQGRLIGTLWPIPAPQVGQYAAVLTGLTILLWATRRIDGRSAAWMVPPAIGILLLSHTRTAVIALVAALVFAGLTLALTSERTRRAMTVTITLAGVVIAGFGSAVVSWFARGQDADQLTSLTGRQNVWDDLLAQPRTLSEQLFGEGLTNKSFNGLPIDNSWLAIYYDQGVVGVTIVAVLLVGLLIAASLRPPSPARACAVFLILYCVIASYTEAGLGDASPYFLHLAVATSLLSRGAPRDEPRDEPSAAGPTGTRERQT